MSRSSKDDDFDRLDDDDLSDLNDDDFGDVEGDGGAPAMGAAPRSRSFPERPQTWQDEEEEPFQPMLPGIVGEDDDDPRAVVDLSQIPPNMRIRTTVFPDLDSAIEYLRSAKILQFSQVFYRSDVGTFGVAIGDSRAINIRERGEWRGDAEDDIQF